MYKHSYISGRIDTIRRLDMHTQAGEHARSHTHTHTHTDIYIMDWWTDMEVLIVPIRYIGSCMRDVQTHEWLDG